MSEVAADPGSQLILRLDGFEGPMDLLLDLARGQKLDLARISILALVDQYLLIVEGARRVRLELAADWLVMAAWLTWLKSRLLLPPEAAEAVEGEIAADALAARLQALQSMRLAARWLDARPQLGIDMFRRGAPEDLTELDRSRLKLDLPSLMRAYLGALRRAGTGASYRPRQVTLWTIKDALARLNALLGAGPEWVNLEAFLPEGLPDGVDAALHRRSAMASTLLAGLELARGGGVRLRQDADFGPILLQPGVAEPSEDAGS